METVGLSFSSRMQLGALLNDMGLDGVGVEVGVHVGWFAHHLRRDWKGRLLVGVDPWEPYDGADWDKDTHEQNYRHAVTAMASFGAGAELLRMRSADAAKTWRHGPLDFVYLDGAHDYANVAADIAAWWPLVRPGGVMAGHDFIPDGWHRDGDPVNAYATREEVPEKGGVALFGVQRAVREFFPGGRIRLTATDLDGGYRSWLVVKS